MEAETYKFIWQGIEIEARYIPLDMGIIAHLEIEAINPPCAPLPMTETGYWSHFHKPGTIEAHGDGVIQFVTDWLNEEAKSKEWQNYVEASRQGQLF